MKTEVSKGFKAALFFIVPVFLFLSEKTTSAGDKTQEVGAASDQKTEVFDPRKNGQLSGGAQQYLEEMEKNESQSTIDNVVRFGVENSAWMEKGGLFASAYKLLANTRNILVQKRAKGFCFDQNEDSFILMARYVSCALEIPDLGSAFYGATLCRQEIFDLLQKGSAIDPEALRLLDRHLYCLANKYVKKSDEMVSIRSEMLNQLPGSGRFQNLRNLIQTENIRELGEFYLWDGDYKNADKVFEIGENNGDEVAKAKRLCCYIYLNQPDGLEKKLGESLQSHDFRALMAASVSHLLWGQASGDIDRALKTVQKMQDFLDGAKKADMKGTGEEIKDIRYANRLLLYQWELSVSKIRLLALQKNIQALKPEAELIGDILLQWTSACMSPSST